jgi:hypothetical protein
MMGSTGYVNHRNDHGLEVMENKAQGAISLDRYLANLCSMK